MSLPLQAIYNRVRDHLLAQNAKSMHRDRFGYTSCAYRGDAGHQCAVGCFITDECYSPALEGRSVVSLHVGKALVCSGVLDESDILRCTDDGSLVFDKDEHSPLRLLQSLQRLHDSDAIAEWPEALAVLAHQWGLTP